MDSILSHYSINTRGIKITDAIKTYIDKKLQFLEKFSKYIESIHIEITENKGESLHMKYEISVMVKKGLIRVEERGTDLYAVIDLVHDILKTKFDKYKEQYTKHSKEKTSTMMVDAISEEIINLIDETTPIYIPQITKRKSYSDNRPLSPEEAIEQMEMIGHSSFLFKNIQTNKYTMVYKRKDGNYGLVEPENA